MNIEVKRLSWDLIDDYLKFFDDIAFCDNPEWSLCYCCFNYLEDGNDVDTREYCQELIKAGKLNGFLAFEDGIPVGWCNCDAITNYPRLMKNPAAKEKEDTVVVVCFTIDPNKRRKGIASKLLESAIKYYKESGYNWIEASTMKGASSDAENYTGPLKLYKNLGFKVTNETDRFYLLKREL